MDYYNTRLNRINVKVDKYIKEYMADITNKRMRYNANINQIKSGMSCLVFNDHSTQPAKNAVVQSIVNNLRVRVNF